MRGWPILVLVFAFVFAVRQAGAQQNFSAQTARSMIGSAGSRPIQMQVVDMSRAIAPVSNIANSFRPARAPQTFMLSRVFPKITVAPFPIKLPSIFSKGNSFKTINPQSAFQTMPLTSAVGR